MIIDIAELLKKAEEENGGMPNALAADGTAVTEEVGELKEGFQVLSQADLLATVPGVPERTTPNQGHEMTKPPGM